MGLNLVTFSSGYPFQCSHVDTFKVRDRRKSSLFQKSRFRGVSGSDTMRNVRLLEEGH
jgi:hypothetical protein